MLSRVILDSVPAKEQAFRSMFTKYGADIADRVVQYHNEKGGLSRFVKFRWAYEHLLHQEVSEDELKALG